MSDIDVTDNRYLYEKAKTMRELEAADDDHPLKMDKKVEIEPPPSPQIQELTKDLESVAIDWKTLRNITECSCSTPFDHFSRKVLFSAQKKNERNRFVFLFLVSLQEVW